MTNKPKFNFNDKVSFDIIDEGTYIGKIVIINSNGYDIDPNNFSYDILVDDYFGEPCLFKHINEKLIKLI